MDSRSKSYLFLQLSTEEIETQQCSNKDQSHENRFASHANLRTALVIAHCVVCRVANHLSTSGNGRMLPCLTLFQSVEQVVGPFLEAANVHTDSTYASFPFVATTRKMEQHTDLPRILIQATNKDDNHEDKYGDNHEIHHCLCHVNWNHPLFRERWLPVLDKRRFGQDCTIRGGRGWLQMCSYFAGSKCVSSNTAISQ